MTSAWITSRRGFILLAVLLIGMAAILIATSIIFLASAERAGTVSDVRRSDGRAMTRSALRVVMRELRAQRDRMLEGGRQFDLDATYVLAESEARMTVARLLPIASGGDLLMPEAAKLDVNRVTVEMLEATTFIDPDMAAAIIAHRDAIGQFRSIAQLLDVPGIEPEDVYGPLDDIHIQRAIRGEEAGLGERVAERLSGAEIRGLMDLLTVYGHEPAIQRSARRRIALDVAWSDALGERLDERFGDGAGTMMKSIMEQQSFSSMGDVYRLLMQFDVEVERWPDIVDTLMAADVNYHFGRIDINRAPVEVLQALPGIEPAQAADIVAKRERVSAEDLATVAWPLAEEIFEGAQYETMGEWLTTRSWTWRVRLAVGDVAGDDPEGMIEDPIVVEAVIDLSDPAPRIGYLRDISLFETAIRLASLRGDDRDERDDWTREDDPADFDDAPEDSESGDMLDAPDPETGFGFEDDRSAADEAPESGLEEPDPMRDDASNENDTEQPAPTERRIGRWLGGSST